MKVVLGILLITAVAFGVLALQGFIWMICLGALASIFAAPNLAISFWASVLVAVIANVLLGGLFRAMRGND